MMTVKFRLESTISVYNYEWCAKGLCHISKSLHRADVCRSDPTSQKTSDDALFLSAGISSGENAKSLACSLALIALAGSQIINH